MQLDSGSSVSKEPLLAMLAVSHKVVPVCADAKLLPLTLLAFL